MTPYIIIAAFFGVGLVVTLKIRGKPGDGRARLLTLPLAAYASLAIKTNP